MNQISIGDKVYVGIDPYSIYLFDKSSEKSVIDYKAVERLKTIEEL